MYTEIFVGLKKVQKVLNLNLSTLVVNFRYTGWTRAGRRQGEQRSKEGGTGTNPRHEVLYR